MKLYTRKGDEGMTDLFGGQRISKDSLRVETFGTVDELNCIIGLAVAACDEEELAGPLTKLQSRLFDLGADLCTPNDAKHAQKIKRISQNHIDELEQWIDKTCEPLSPMKYFILPGGSEVAARLHHGRAVCRRAERLVVALGQCETINPLTIIFLNRLSDLLFALARRANQLANVDDVPWQG